MSGIDGIRENSFDPVRIEVFKHLYSAIAEEMGVVLKKSSYSPNIKERKDFSCAVFDSDGRMIAQAAHIPVHLGSMPLSVAAAIKAFPKMMPGDTIILNDPFQGGTHLPDITLVSPVFSDQGDHHKTLIGYVGNRAHHADIGGMAPGSMTIAREIYQEGLIIPPVKLIDGGNLNTSLMDLILANVRTSEERLGDLWAQVAANRRGVIRLMEMTDKYGYQVVKDTMSDLVRYTEKLTRRLLNQLPDGTYRFTDYLDDDGVSGTPITITTAITIEGDRAVVDFRGSSPQVKGSLNAVYAITLSAVYYVIRCLIGLDVPNNAGCLVPIQVIAPPGTVVNALPPAPVAGGNVETSQRIVDVLLGAMAKACPDLVPAASQGTMNNLTIGGYDPKSMTNFAYYETIGGGAGASPNTPGPSAVHSHMTNTLNTPIEALEFAYPLRVLRYEIRRGSGGEGKYPGGDGIRRDIQLLTDARVSLITDRRKFSPYGLSGGQPGKPGENLVISHDHETVLPSKGTFDFSKGDVLSIRTPGGGGFGVPED